MGLRGWGLRKERTGALRQLTRVPDSGQSQAGKLNVVHQLELCVTVFFFMGASF